MGLKTTGILVFLMRGISKSRHEQLQLMVVELEQALELEMVNYTGDCDQLVMPIWNELNIIRAKRVSMQELFKNYLKLLRDLDLQISAYETNTNQIRFELKKYRRSSKQKAKN